MPESAGEKRLSCRRSRQSLRQPSPKPTCPSLIMSLSDEAIVGSQLLPLERRAFRWNRPVLYFLVFAHRSIRKPDTPFGRCSRADRVSGGPPRGAILGLPDIADHPLFRECRCWSRRATRRRCRRPGDRCSCVLMKRFSALASAPVLSIRRSQPWVTTAPERPRSRQVR